MAISIFTTPSPWGTRGDQLSDTSRPDAARFQGKNRARQRDQATQANVRRYNADQARKASSSTATPPVPGSQAAPSGGAGDVNFGSFVESGDPNAPLTVPGYGTDRQQKGPQAFIPGSLNIVA